MNSSDEEKQLQLITSLKEQGRRARGRQVRAAAAREPGRLQGAGFRACGSWAEGIAASVVTPVPPLPVEKHFSRPERFGEPRTEGARECQARQCGKHHRLAALTGVQGLEKGAGIWRGLAPTVPPFRREKRVGLDILGGVDGGCSAGPAP